jgi:hypothetical protein
MGAANQEIASTTLMICRRKNDRGRLLAFSVGANSMALNVINTLTEAHRQDYDS